MKPISSTLSSHTRNPRFGASEVSLLTQKQVEQLIKALPSELAHQVSTTALASKGGRPLSVHINDFPSGIQVRNLPNGRSVCNTGYNHHLFRPHASVKAPRQFFVAQATQEEENTLQQSIGLLQRNAARFDSNGQFHPYGSYPRQPTTLNRLIDPENQYGQQPYSLLKLATEQVFDPLSQVYQRIQKRYRQQLEPSDKKDYMSVHRHISDARFTTDGQSNINGIVVIPKEKTMNNYRGDYNGLQLILPRYAQPKKTR
jgi:hypothetical protein